MRREVVLNDAAQDVQQPRLKRGGIVVRLRDVQVAVGRPFDRHVLLVAPVAGVDALLVNR